MKKKTKEGERKQKENDKISIFVFHQKTLGECYPLNEKKKYLNY